MMNGHYLATTYTSSRQIKIWDMLSYKLVATLEHHNAKITQLYYAKDQKVLFSADASNTVIAWMGAPNLQEIYKIKVKT